MISSRVLNIIFSCLRNYERRNVDNTLRLFFVYATYNQRYKGSPVYQKLQDVFEDE